ncbi:MAG: dockerin type I domain-containing protein, partial [Lachnospirales bacterium]
DTVTIKSEIRDGMVFDGWLSDDVEITAERTDASKIVISTFTMPEKDVTITANYLKKLSRADMTLEIPVVGKALPTEMTPLGTNFAISDFAITPNDEVANANTEYVVSAKISAKDGYILSDDFVSYINSTMAEITDNDSGLYTVSYKFTPIISADVNGDGVVDKLDAACVLRYLSNMETLTDKQIEIANVNGGDLDITDVIAILAQ